MAHTLSRDDIAKLPAAERLDLISELWDSLSPDKVPVPESHRRALDEALSEYEFDPNGGQSWQEVRDELFRKK